MEKPRFNLVSFSGGKDSTAMLLRLIEENYPIDCILFCDTGLEFPAMYRHIDKVEKAIGRSITRVKASYSFEYLMLEHQVKRKPGGKIPEENLGYGWPGPRQRWCTSKLKDGPREQFLKPLREKYTIYEYVGIAADESYRLERQRNRDKNHVHPLVDWDMSEADCLQYCLNRGYDWEGLYQHFGRVSCWCCPLQPLEELRKLRVHFPQLWLQLQNWEKKNWRKFHANCTVMQLDARFALEEEFIKAGRSIKDRAFFRALKDRWETTNEANKLKDGC